MRSVEPQRIRDINWWPGNADASKPWPVLYQAGPCCSEDHTTTFRSEIVSGLAEANPKAVLYVHQRTSDINIEPFFNIFCSPIILDDKTDLLDCFS